MMGVADRTHYAALKVGVIGFSKFLAREVVGNRIH
jgi:NAD(P)-dependent dehydrogenase (short-subunit alcohol dehydrogenase family)